MSRLLKRVGENYKEKNRIQNIRDHEKLIKARKEREKLESYIRVELPKMIEENKVANMRIINSFANIFEIELEEYKRALDKNSQKLWAEAAEEGIKTLGLAFRYFLNGKL